MMNKGFKLGVSLLPFLLLTGCLNNVNQDNANNGELGPDQASVQTTGHQLSDDFYRAVIVDGQYQLGASASVDSTLSSAGNSQAFEAGLLRISREVFPTDQYYLQEGQLIDSEALTSWTARESETNPEGLNPALSKEEQAQQEAEASSSESTDPADNPENPEQENQESNNQVIVNNDATPIYLSQIMEKDIMVETEDGYALSGIVIGLAMNSVYEYTDSEGTVHQQEISVGEMRERGKQYANIIVGRLRNTAELRSIPIVVGLYRVAPNNEVVGGTYLVDGISREGNSVTDWTERNEYRVALPIVEAGQSNDQFIYFDQFSDQVRDFFPNLNGISGEALYINDTLETLRIEIVSQFYQYTEITALAQYVTDAAKRHLPEGIDIEINIVSTNGIEAFIGRKPGETEFASHIFY
ncbi:CamS family sex pheromone protein [Hutsoniella sourekii]|uniref:CamS family sex pheromone protein n=1 Tax=Hutsoniella sourekii TaxID=87650 RepID=UPI000482A139|nr:CamS family sex pheromone protein [Hutsoniella sourekii]